MRLLVVSVTKSFPLPSTAMPRGPLNCPSALPRLPHVLRKVPHGSVVVVEVVEVVVAEVVVVLLLIVVVVVVVVVGQTSVTIPPPSVVTAGVTQLFSTT